MIFTSINNENIKNIKKLNTKKYRDEQRMFLVEGDHLVEEAIKHNKLETLIITEKYNGINFKNKIIVNEKVMKYLSSLDTPKEIMGICKKNNCSNIGKKVIALDGVQDPGNLGTIIRSANAFNIDTILISKDTVDPYNSKVVRASQGMILNTNIIECNLSETLETLSDYKIYGTSVVNGENIKNIVNPEKFVIVMGNEGNGVSECVKKECNDFIYIPMNQNCESLNVAVAASILMYELNGGV